MPVTTVPANPDWVILSDELSGGAATTANRLAQGLLATGLRVERWHFSEPQQGVCAAPSVSLDAHPKETSSGRLLRSLSNSLASHLRRQRHMRALLTLMADHPPRVLNLHNLHACGLDHEVLLGLPAQTMLVWTLHDCWPVAPFAFEWAAGLKGAFEVENPDGPTTEAASSRRSHFFAQFKKTCCVSPSRWLAYYGRTRVASWVRMKHIPYGVPVDQFRPLDSTPIRRELGLDPSMILIGLTAGRFSSRKGADILFEAVRRLQRADVHILLWGDDQNLAFPTDLEVHRAGFVSDPSLLVRLYSACDLVACPSRIDNLPHAILESFACGVPVVGSAVGGIPDAVRPGHTGWLYEGNSAEACAHTLAQAFTERPWWDRYRARCRDVAETEYSLEAQARGYHQLLTWLEASQAESGSGPSAVPAPS